MKNKKIFNLAIFNTILLLSCHKDCVKPNIPNINCVDSYFQKAKLIDNVFDIYKGNNNAPNCWFGLDSVDKDKYGYSNLCINPNNQEEFVFLRRTNSTNTTSFRYDLFVYNFCTNSKKLIAQNAYYSPDWSSKDWIIYTGTDVQLWKVKPNGDSLTRLTNTGDYNNDARWSPDGDSYLYYDAALNLNNPYKMSVSGSDGNPKFFINRNMLNWAWKSDTEIVFSNAVPVGSVSTSPIKIYNTKTTAIENVTTIEALGNGLITVKNGVIYLMGNSGFQKIENKVATLIDKNYPYFRSGSGQLFSEKYYLMSKLSVDSVGLDSCIAYGHNFITLVDKNTKQEKHVLIPE
jgi:hypothetical protein